MDAIHRVLGKQWDKKGNDRRAALAGAVCAEGLARAQAAADEADEDEDDTVRASGGLPRPSAQPHRASRAEGGANGMTEDRVAAVIP